MDEKKQISREDATEALKKLRRATDAYSDMFEDLRKLIISELEPMSKKDELSKAEEEKIALLSKVADIMQKARESMESKE